jgi:hypothetical protein
VVDQNAIRFTSDGFSIFSEILLIVAIPIHELAVAGQEIVDVQLVQEYVLLALPSLPIKHEFHVVTQRKILEPTRKVDACLSAQFGVFRKIRRFRLLTILHIFRPLFDNFLTKSYELFGLLAAC